MIKNFKSSRIAAVLVALGLSLAVQGCANGKPNLNTSLQALSESEDPDFKVDDYLQEILEENDTSMSELESQLNDAYLEGDKKKCNEILAKILEAELKAIVAEGLGVPKEELKDYAVTGYYVEAPMMDTGFCDEYGMRFELNGIQYEYKGEGLARSAFFCWRAAMQNQLDMTGDGNTVQAAYNLAKKLMLCDLYLKDKPESKKMVKGSANDLSQHIIFNGRVNFRVNPEKRETTGKIKVLK